MWCQVSTLLLTRFIYPLNAPCHDIVTLLHVNTWLLMGNINNTSADSVGKWVWEWVFCLNGLTLVKYTCVRDSWWHVDQRDEVCGWSVTWQYSVSVCTCVDVSVLQCVHCVSVTVCALCQCYIVCIVSVLHCVHCVSVTVCALCQCYIVCIVSVLQCVHCVSVTLCACVLVLHCVHVCMCYIVCVCVCVTLCACVLVLVLQCALCLCYIVSVLQSVYVCMHVCVCLCVCACVRVRVQRV